MVGTQVDPTCVIEPGAIVEGPVRIGADVRICAGAIVRGPVVIGEGAMIGNNAVVRGPSALGRGCRIGFAAEIKSSVLGDEVAIGPQSYVGDSLVEDAAYLGAQVRTSNHRLDKRNVTALIDGQVTDTGCEKLGCHIGRDAALGIHCIILPGRSVAGGTIVGPGIIIEKNLPAGRYRLAQNIIGDNQ
ncbi:hypothetical protein [Croceicoccus sp. BE223]|uniref:hypothetical protein n=1 Tax=Croceicoccus sp. BE223 TaxID=2817716 RepID=UPI00285E5296|nr:hypothetical protein [Croceicoccus sp. BE223]MDR7103013.1 bifunctional UDP-N-acetylglucosamine pyrophosphorylase/glucosamine-1-phosphate N-acetyltransferase [Croceicoccus sp. BE223]